MSATRWAVRALELVAVLAVLALVAGQALGQPVLLSYVTSGSMAPTLETNDGFVAVPVELSGPVEEGDVVVFRAENVNEGQLTTHRVVEETDRGLVTQGDANAFTDQADGEPPVKRAQVVATALEVGGSVVVIPNLGAVVEGFQSVIDTAQRRLAALLGTGALLGTQGLAYVLFALSVVAYAVDVFLNSGRSERRTRERSRDTGLDARLVVGVLALVLVASATAAMVGPAGAERIEIVSADFESDRPGVIAAGTTENVTYSVSNGGYVPVVVFLEPATERVEVSPREARIGGRDRVNATVTLSAPPETGYYRQFFVEHRYLAVLPLPVTRSLHSIHPWLPIVLIDALLGVPFYLLGVRLVGTGRLRRRQRDGTSALGRIVDRYG